MHRSSSYPWTYVESWLAGRQATELFADVRTYAMFIGHPRSGTSFLGSVLNAHRHACIANELNALKYVRRRYNRQQLYWLIKKRDEWYGRRGRVSTGYDSVIEQQWQGRWEQLQLIGDKKAARSTEQIAKCPGLMDRLQKVVGVPIRMIHLVRDPYNVITTIHLRQPHISLETAAREFFARCETNWQLMQTHGEAIHTVRLEALITEPETSLIELCQFLKLDTVDNYVRDCAPMIFSKPRQTKFEKPWSPELIDFVRAEIDKYPYLEAYRFQAEELPQAAA